MKSRAIFQTLLGFVLAVILTACAAGQKEGRFERAKETVPFWRSFI